MINLKKPLNEKVSKMSKLTKSYFSKEDYPQSEVTSCIGKNQVKRHDPNCGCPNDPSLTPPEITQIAAKATRKPKDTNRKIRTIFFIDYCVQILVPNS